MISQPLCARRLINAHPLCSSGFMPRGVVTLTNRNHRQGLLHVQGLLEIRRISFRAKWNAVGMREIWRLEAYANRACAAMCAAAIFFCAHCFSPRRFYERASPRDRLCIWEQSSRPAAEGAIRRVAYRITHLLVRAQLRRWPVQRRWGSPLPHSQNG